MAQVVHHLSPLASTECINTVNDQTRPLTVKEAKLVQAKLEGKTHHEAYDIAGYSQNSSKATKVANTDKVLKRPNVQAALQKALAKHGINIDSAIAPIGKGLKAVKQNEYTGEITEDIKTQLAASDRALKLMGISGDTNITVNGPAQFVQVAQRDRDEFGI